MSPAPEPATDSAAPAGVRGTGDRPLALQVIGVSKRFGSLLANDAVDVHVPAGSIHAVVGENGAGKTTLMRIVYGLYRPDGGTIRIAGRDVSFGSPREALAHGVAMVHQTSLLVGSMSVAENIQLSITGRRRPSRRQVVERLAALSAASGLGLDPKATVDSLSVGMRQRAEVLGALYHQARLLILDEPTTVLTPQEAEQLFAILRDLAGRGTTIIVVTHKLREVLAVAQQVTVLRAGRVVAEAQTVALTEDALVQMMVGRDVALTVSTGQPWQARQPAAADPPLRVVDLTVADASGIRRVHSVSLRVDRGELVVLTGVEGNGQRELVEAIIGLRRPSSGQIHLAGATVTALSVRRRRRRGLGYIPEARATEALAAELSVADNLVLGQHTAARFARYGIRRVKNTRDFARAQMVQFNVAAADPAMRVATLSGGNAQKVVVAREVSKHPAVLLAVQPTQGVDVASTHTIRQTLQRLREQGMGILLVTSDLREACDLADRAVVLYSGTVAGELVRDQLTEQRLGALAAGIA